jgi:hypothetical protein
MKFPALVYKLIENLTNLMYICTLVHYLCHNIHYDDDCKIC